MQHTCVRLVTRLDTQYNSRVMLKPVFQHLLASLQTAFSSRSTRDDKSTSPSSTPFVARLTAFVVVGVLSLGVFVPGAFANNQLGIDSGVACGTTADCNSSNPAVQCINNTCQVTQQSIQDAAKLDQQADVKEFNKSLVEFETQSQINKEAHTFQSTAFTAGTFTLGILGRPDANGDLQAGLVPSMNNTLAVLLEGPPATTYIAMTDFLNTAGLDIAQPAYAQGFGFVSLNPILEAWKTFRTIAFIFFVMIMLVIGFLIMFRQKVGQAAITAQQAIPSIIIALITVSFSYAIAGFLIDLMYLVMTLMLFMFDFAGDRDAILGMNTLELGGTLISAGYQSAYEIVSTAVTSLSPANSLVDAVFTNDGAGAFAGWSVQLVVALAILFGMFRLFFELLKTYINIIISITLAPLILMFGAIPGRNVFGSWIKGLVGNLAAFPVVLLVILIYDQITGGLSNTAGVAFGENGGFAPPYLIGSASSLVIEFVVGLGILMIMTDLVTQAKKTLGAGSGPFEQFGSALTDSLKKGWTGGELIPGLAISDTRKLPGGKFAGSAQNILKTSAATAGGAAGVAGGAARGSFARRYQGDTSQSAWKGVQDTAPSWARRVGGFVGHEVIKPKEEKKS